MKAHAILGGLSAVMLLIVIVGCGGGGGQVSQPQISQFRDASGRSVRDTNSNGVPDLPLDARPTIVPSFSGFAPGQAVEVQVFRNGVPVLPQPLLLTADVNGNILPTPILWDVGVDPQTGQPVDATGTYVVVASGEGRQVTFTFEILAGRSTSVGNRQAASGVAVILAGLPAVYAQGSVLSGTPVWVEGFGFPANQQVKLFVVRDRDDWTDGSSLTDESGGAETATTDGSGNLPRTQVWASAQRRGTGQTDGDYDVVVDVNRNDRFDTATDVVVSAIGTGFTVQEPPVGSQHLAVELAASQQGAFKDEFGVTENISVWLNPPWRPLAPYQVVRKYIVLHKSSWQDGDILVDVTGRHEQDLMRYACANQYSCPVWLAPLRPGKYDVVIDMDRDGKYTLGVDYIDAGINSSGQQVKEAGFVVSGTFPPIRLALSAQSPVLNANEQTVILAQVQTNTGLPVSGATVNFSIVGGQGGQLSAGSATTDSSGIAQVNLSATQPNTNLVIQGAVTLEGQSAQAQVDVRVRAFGELQAIFR